MTATWTAIDGSTHETTVDDRRGVATVYAAMFAGRLDAYSVWAGEHWITACAAGCLRCTWMGSHRGDDVPDDVPAHQRAPLTPDVVLHAFETRRPISGYLLARDSTTHLLALDVDRDDGLLLCDRVAKVMTKAGVTAYIEPSRRGAHLWATLTRPIPGIAARRALRAFLQAAGAPDDPKIELRPGQDRLNGPDGLGNALRMPLMPHQATGRAPGPLMAPGGRIVAERVTELVQRVEEADADVVLEWSERYRPPLDPKNVDPRDRPPRPGLPRDDGTTATSLLSQVGVPRAAPGRAVRCPFHPDDNPSLQIFGDDRRVKCHQAECEANNYGRGLGTYQLRKLIRERGLAA